MEKLNYMRWISGAAQPKLTQDRLMSIDITVPPREEQDRIITAAKAETVPFRATIDRAHREIGLLREYRTRLIADVVTGKLDVRAAAARLPEESDEDGRGRFETGPYEDDAEALAVGDNDTDKGDLHAVPAEAET
jgi:type I restriction enzyme S subunit